MSSSGAGATNPTVNEYYNSITPVTKIILLINILVHISIFLTSFPVMALAINEHLVIDESVSLEIQFGSLQLLFFTLWTIFANGFLYCALCYIMFMATGDKGQKYVSGIGYSGVLFTYAIVESYHSTEQYRSVFGIFTVPAKVYPFILLVIIQVVLPGISLFGHLAGVLTGILTVSGVMQLLLPSQELLLLLERHYGASCVLSTLSRMSRYVPSTNRSLVHQSFQGLSASQVTMGLCTGVYTVLQHMWHLLALLAVVFLPPSLAARCAPLSDCIANIIRAICTYPFGSRTAGSGSTVVDVEEGGLALSTTMNPLSSALNPLSSARGTRGLYAKVASIESGANSPLKSNQTAPVLL